MLFLFCFLNRNNVLEEIRCSCDDSEDELSTHLENSIGMQLDSILEFPGNAECGYFRFTQNVYWYDWLKDLPGTNKNRLLFISDSPAQLKYYTSVLDHVAEGIQFFDERGILQYLNKTCEKMENLKLENEKGKHILQIYEVSYQNSTILNTLRHRKVIENISAVFQSCSGTKYYSVNTGIPVYIENFFLGAIGLVYDKNTFAEIEHKREIMQGYLKENQMLDRIGRPRVKVYDTFDDIIGESEVLKRSITLAKKVSSGDVSVLLFGETGVGKEIFAQSIHSASPRRDKEFMAINCAALPATIIESLLFGTVKGAFTGSLEQKGLFEVADGGTIFLDELNSMDINLQSKLLRVIQDKSFRKVGGTQLIHCNVRFISAINETPADALMNKHLREDLYYRLGVITIEIPPLRERKQDIMLLANAYLPTLSIKYFREFSKITDEVAAAFLEYNWPGNIRELFQVLEHACNLMENNDMRLEHLPSSLFQPVPDKKRIEPVRVLEIEKAEEEENDEDDGEVFFLPARLDAYERHIIERELSKNSCNITKTARQLGITRQNLQHRMKKCGIKISSHIEENR